MSRQEHNDWRNLHSKPVNHEAIMENPMAAQGEGTATAETRATPETKKARADDALPAESEAGTANVTVEIPHPSNWDSFTPSQKSHLRRRNNKRNK